MNAKNAYFLMSKGHPLVLARGAKMCAQPGAAPVTIDTYWYWAIDASFDTVVEAFASQGLNVNMKGAQRHTRRVHLSEATVETILRNNPVVQAVRQDAGGGMSRADFAAELSSNAPPCFAAVVYAGTEWPADKPIPDGMKLAG